MGNERVRQFLFSPNSRQWALSHASVTKWTFQSSAAWCMSKDNSKLVDWQAHYSLLQIFGILLTLSSCHNAFPSHVGPSWIWLSVLALPNGWLTEFSRHLNLQDNPAQPSQPSDLAPWVPNWICPRPYSPPLRPSSAEIVEYEEVPSLESCHAINWLISHYLGPNTIHL